VTFTPLEIAAVAFTLAGVILAIYENIWTWPIGIAGVLLYLVVNWHAHLYANGILQIVYFVLSIHGWYEWLHGGTNKTELYVTRTTRRQWIGCSIATVVLTIAIFELLRLTTDATFPFWDALTTAISLVAQWMMNEKLLENWMVWFVVDVIYVVIYIQQSLYLTAGLYAIFVVLCVWGYIDWLRSARAHASA
jgi:nicotinamide mononucleotide transporter